MEALLQPKLTPSPNVKPMINVGALLDIPTGHYLTGPNGESILSGGVGTLTGIVGIGNNFKTTIMRHMSLTALGRMSGSRGSTYDTEVNTHEDRIRQLASRIDGLEMEDIIDNGRWVLTDKTVYSADQWYDILKEWLVEKRKSGAKIMRNTPFMNRDRSGRFQMMTPTFTEVDSLSEFVTADVLRMQDENSLGDSGANTMSMRQGLQKNRFLMEMPSIAAGANHYMFLTAHIGQEFNLDPRSPPQKKLQYLKGGLKLKGVPEKFTFITNNCWLCYNAAPLIKQDSKTPEYPRDSNDDLKGDTDLNEVNLTLLRNKSGPSGMTTQLIVSQSEGVLPSLSEFHYIKGRDRFGINGTLQNYELDLLPGVKLSRTAVRHKIDENPALRRALNITSELCQMTELWHGLDEGLLCTPAELFNDLKAKGYDWDVLLNTRGFWTLDDDHPVPFLSTMDLLNMRQDKYKPYWL